MKKKPGIRRFTRDGDNRCGETADTPRPGLGGALEALAKVEWRAGLARWVARKRKRWGRKFYFFFIHDIDRT